MKKILMRSADSLRIESALKNGDNIPVKDVIALDEDFSTRFSTAVFDSWIYLDGTISILLTKSAFVDPHISENHIFRVDVCYNTLYSSTIVGKALNFRFSQAVIAVESNDSPAELMNKMINSLKIFDKDLVLTKSEVEDKSLFAKFDMVNFKRISQIIESNDFTIEEAFSCERDSDHSGFYFSGPRKAYPTTMVVLNIPEDSDELEMIPDEFLTILGKKIKKEENYYQSELNKIQSFKNRFSKDTQLLWEVN